jgi:hypothetical protein
MKLFELDKKPHPLTVEQYMALDIPERTELLGGVIYDVPPKHYPHAFAVANLTQIIARAIDVDKYFVHSQNPIAVNGWQGKDAPEIDVAVVAKKSYRRTPTAADSLAFVEVSDSTYRDDRGYKIPLYVKAGVPSWIVNIPLRQVELYESPLDLKRKHGRIIAIDGSFEILGMTIRVSDLFLPDSDGDA